MQKNFHTHQQPQATMLPLQPHLSTPHLDPMQQWGQTLGQMQVTQKASFPLGSRQLASALSFLLPIAFGLQVLTWPQTALILVH